MHRRIFATTPTSPSRCRCRAISARRSISASPRRVHWASETSTSHRCTRSRRRSTASTSFRAERADRARVLRNPGAAVCSRFPVVQGVMMSSALQPAPAGSLWDNPLGTDGFEFIEYAAPDPAALGRLFEQMGFTAIAKHRSKNVLLYRQGDVNFIVNAEPGSFAQAFARVHGPSICAIAFRVRDAAVAMHTLVEQGAWQVE